MHLAVASKFGSLPSTCLVEHSRQQTDSPFLQLLKKTILAAASKNEMKKKKKTSSDKP